MTFLWILGTETVVQALNITKAAATKSLTNQLERGDVPEGHKRAVHDHHKHLLILGDVPVVDYEVVKDSDVAQVVVGVCPGDFLVPLVDLHVVRGKQEDKIVLLLDNDLLVLLVDLQLLRARQLILEQLDLCGGQDLLPVLQGADHHDLLGALADQELLQVAPDLVVGLVVPEVDVPGRDLQGDHLVGRRVEDVVLALDELQVGQHLHLVRGHERVRLFLESEELQSGGQQAEAPSVCHAYDLVNLGLCGESRDLQATEVKEVP